MFVINVAVIVAGLVLVAQQVNAHCTCSCSGGGTEIIGGGIVGSGPTWFTGTGGCGLGPGVDMCGCSKGTGYGGASGIGGTLSSTTGGILTGTSLTGGVSGIVGIENTGVFGTGPHGSHSNAPIVVRPQEVPRPAVALPVSLTPVPGPCVCKKAIVKPAVLPKPVCKAAPHIIGGTYGVGGVYGTKTITNNIHHTTSTLVGSGIGGVGAVGGSVAGGPIVLDHNLLYKNEANLAPADAVSLSLAYKTAHKGYQVPMEDRLTFGFRKIPEEVPHRVVFKKNIPEEQIFNLNGQIVELKPVQLAPQKTLEEEAHEDLFDLQEEETNSAHYGTATTGLRRLSLGEIGYGPAKLHKNTFVDVPSGAVGEAVHGIGQAVSGALGGAGAGSAAGAAAEAAAGALGAVAGAVGNLLSGGKDGYVAGNVVYKTVPKLNQLLAPLPDVAPDDGECQSQETNDQSISYNGVGGFGGISGLESVSTTGIVGSGVSCGMCCKPCCHTQTFHSTSSSSSSSSVVGAGKRATVLVQRLTS